MDRDYEPLIIDLKKSDPIRSTRGSLTLFLLALLMGVVSVTTFLISSVYKGSPTQAPSLEIIDLKTDVDAVKLPTKLEPSPAVNAEASKSEPKPAPTGTVGAPKSEPPRKPVEAEPVVSTPLPAKPSEETPAPTDKSVGTSQAPKKDKGAGVKNSSGDKPPPVEEGKGLESKSPPVEPPERARTDRNRGPERGVGFGFITVRTVPENVSVYLNEKLIGTTPLIEFQVPAGRHELKLAYENARPLYQSITVDPLQTVSVFQEFEKVEPLDKAEEFQRFGKMGSVAISSSSSGAAVYLVGADRTYQGFTPFFKDLPEGTYQLSVQKDGFKTVKRTFEVTEGKTTEVFVTLKRLGIVYPDRRYIPETLLPNPRALEDRRPERPYR